MSEPEYINVQTLIDQHRGGYTLNPQRAIDELAMRCASIQFTGAGSYRDLLTAKTSHRLAIPLEIGGFIRGMFRVMDATTEGVTCESYSQLEYYMPAKP